MAYEEVRERLHPDYEGTPSIFDGYEDGITPEDRRDMFRTAEYLWYKLGTYRQGIHKVISYFMTEADVSGASRERNDEWRKLLNNKVDVLNVLKAIAVDYLQYGNSFSSLMFPIRRYLNCPEDDCEMSISIHHISYEFVGGDFVAECPKCGHEGPMVVDDRKSYKSDNIYVHRWNPHNIEIEHCPISDDETIYWTPGEKWKTAVNNASHTVLANTPLPIIEAVVEDKKLRLNNNLVHHLKFHHLSGVDAGGWGIPPVISAFDDVYYLRLLKRFQEGVGRDFLFPIRLLTPAIKSAAPESGTDPLRSTGMEGMPQVQDKLLEMIQEARRNPESYHAVPFPVQEGTVNGQGVKMLRPDLMKQASGELLNSLGVPVEFYRGNMKWRGDPQAIRLLEKNWEHLTSALDSWLNWACELIAMARNWDNVDAKLKPPSMFDDPARRQILLQLAAQGEVSKETALKPWNIDLEQERKNLRKEREQMQKEQEEMEADQLTGLPNLAALGQGMGPPQGGMGSPGGMGAPAGGGMGMPGGMMPQTSGGATPMTVNNLEEQAKQMTQKFLSMPRPQREQALRQLGDENETLHHVVTGMMEEARQQADQEGAMMAREQSFGAV